MERDEESRQEELFSAPRLSRREMELAYQNRDASYDGLFYVAVSTTGVFCRASCPSRPAKPENIEYCASAEEALAAGFRPCERCRPMEARCDGAPEWTRRLLESVEADPKRKFTDSDLRTLGIDPTAARRWFLKTFGMTFHSYSRIRRIGAAYGAIRGGAQLDEAILDHGWESYSAFRDAFGKAVGMAPGQSRGADLAIIDWLETPIGPMIAGASAEKLLILEFVDGKRAERQIAGLSDKLGRPFVLGRNSIIDQAKTELDEYFSGDRRTFTIPLDFPGTDFEVRVWNGLLGIPYGATISYAELAARIGSPGASRAVGSANGRNRIAILIPCHRVIAADGGLGGYGGGIWRKLRLLEREGSAPPARLIRP